MKSASQQRALQEISLEFDNVRCAWWQAVERFDLSALAEAVEPLWLFSEFRGRLHDGEDLFRSARADFSRETSQAGEPSPATTSVSPLDDSNARTTARRSRLTWSTPSCR